MARADVLHFTPSDYLSDYKTARLDLIEHGAYCLLLWHMWTGSESQCKFPLDYRLLGGIWGVCPEEAERITDSLTAPRIGVVSVQKRRDKACLFSKRLQQQKNHAEAYRDKQRTKGIQSGRVRRANALNRGSTVVEPERTVVEPSCHVSRSHVTRSRVRDNGGYENPPECMSQTHGDKTLWAHLMDSLSEHISPTWATKATNVGRFASAITAGCPEGCEGGCANECAEHFDALITKHAEAVGLLYHTTENDPRPWAEA